jgi:hypothetical protein
MAIDSREKRQSVARCGVKYMRPPVYPNASKPKAWRQAVACIYSGIAVAAPPGVSGALFMYHQRKRKSS